MVLGTLLRKKTSTPSSIYLRGTIRFRIQGLGFNVKGLGFRV